MIEAEQDVLDAEPQVGRRDREPARRRLHDEAGGSRRETRHLRRAVTALDAHQGIRQRRLETGDLDRLADEPSGALHAPPLGDRGADVDAHWLRDRGAARRQRDGQRESHLAARRALPEHLEAPGLDLSQL